ncbi:MAG: PEP-CTERM sorting domain-containing protein [Planctomycetes bacterium]|nr:PEP-CTERM sorting domain-containing protein [Planctomycetota bacterium]
MVAMVAAAAAAGPAGPVAAATIELASGNSSAMVETDTGLGLWSWMVDGVEHAGQVWSWYRLDGDRLPVNLLPEVSVDAGADWMEVVYRQEARVELAMHFELDGGSPGSGLSSMRQEVTITNLSSEPLAVSLFHYADLDADGQWDANTLWFEDDKLLQSGSISLITIEPDVDADFHTVGHPLALMDLLDDASEAGLDNASGPVMGDVGGLLQWDLLINEEDSQRIRLDIEIVPEPSALALPVGVGLVGLRRRKRGR